MTKLSRISFFLFSFFYSYLWLRIIVFNYLYTNYGGSGFITGVVSLIIIFILLNVVTKITKRIKDKKIMTTNIKWIILVINLLETILLLCFVSIYLSDVFITNSNVFIILLFLSVGIIYISNMRPKEIIDLSTLFYILGFLLIVVSFVAVPKMEAKYLLIGDLSYDSGIVFLILFLFLNNIKLTLFDDENKKYNFSIPVIFGIGLMVIEYGMLIMIVGDKALIGIDYVGFLKLSFMPVTKYFGDFNFVYIYLLIVNLVFKCGYDLSLFNYNIKNNKKIINIIELTVIFISGVIFIFNVPIDNELFKYVIAINGLLIVVICYILWGKYHARKN